LVDGIPENISLALISLGLALLGLVLENLLKLGLSLQDNLWLLPLNLNAMPMIKVTSCRG
jgi:hypothetical protein